LARSISARDQISSAPSVSAEPIEQQSGDRSIPRSRPRRRIGRRSAILAAIVVAVRGLLALKG